MNEEKRRANISQAGFASRIRWRGGDYTPPEAGALAAQELNRQNFSGAIELYNLLLARISGPAEMFNNRGAALQKLGRYAEALADYDQAIALKPGYANAWHNRGGLLKTLNHYEEAIKCYDQALALNPQHAEACNNRGVILQEMNCYAEALTSFDKAIALNPGHAEAVNNRGVVMVNLGNFQEAEKMFLKVLELKPDFPAPLFSLVSIRKYDDKDNAEMAAIRTMLGRPGVSLDDKECLYFALGKIYDDCGSYDEAFSWYGLANRLRNQKVVYDPERVRRNTNAILEAFGRNFLAEPFSCGPPSRSPVFVVGMPRSGTTLLTNMLSNHSLVATAGELPAISDFAGRMRSPGEREIHWPQWVTGVEKAAAERLLNDYERRLRRDVGMDIPYVIDKNPLNFSNLGLISKLFPNARIIHCTRHPLATGLSNFFQRFPFRLSYSFNLRNIGHFYGEYARLMDHWRRVLPLKMLEISYEDTVNNTEQVARRALDFLGLEWDARCLAPHTNPCAIESASHWQVRRPIYRQSLSRWRHYEPHLGPLIESLRLSGLE